MSTVFMSFTFMESKESYLTVCGFKSLSCICMHVCDSMCVFLQAPPPHLFAQCPTLKLFNNKTSSSPRKSETTSEETNTHTHTLSLNDGLFAPSSHVLALKATVTDGGICLHTTTNTNQWLQIPAAPAGDSHSDLRQSGLHDWAVSIKKEEIFIQLTIKSDCCELQSF